jgi:hypothetical protein
MGLATLLSPAASAQPQQEAHSLSIARSIAIVPQASSCPPTIRYGSTGWWVWALQDELNKYSYEVSGPYLEEDSIFGSKTKAGVVKFQRYYHDRLDNRILVDGIVGPQTWRLLGFC